MRPRPCTQQFADLRTCGQQVAHAASRGGPRCGRFALCPRTCGRQFADLRSAIHGPAVGNPRTPHTAADLGAEDSLCARVFLLQIRKFVFGRRMLFPGAAAPQNHASHGSRRKPGDNGGSYGWAASCGKGKRRPCSASTKTRTPCCIEKGNPPPQGEENKTAPPQGEQK